MCPNSDFDHFEVLLPGAAFRTSPVHRDILPTRPGRDPLLWEACRFVIDEAADQTHPGFEILLFRHQVGIGYNGPSHHNLSDEPPASYRRFFAAQPMSASALPPIVLAFAAADPTGGAGVQADLLTLASMGCHALSVITAITVQDTAGVENLQAI